MNYYNKYLKYKNKYLKLVAGQSKKKNIYIGTLNLSFAVQEELEAEWPSEEDFVKHCKNKYNNIRNCYYNSLKLINNLINKNVVLFGFQEVVKNINKNPDDLLANLQKNKTFKNEFSYAEGKSRNTRNKAYARTLLIWKTKLFGKEINRLNFNLALDFDECEHDARDCVIIYTDKNYLLINVHFPWIDTEEQIVMVQNRINEELSTIKINTNPKIIITGDFNDATGKINKNNPLVLNINKKNIKLHNNMTSEQIKTDLLSCCWHKQPHKKGWGHYDAPGDYVLSNNFIKKNFIYNTSKLLGKNEFYSDHKLVLGLYREKK